LETIIKLKISRIKIRIFILCFLLKYRGKFFSIIDRVMVFNIVLQKFLQVLILQTDINRLRMKIDLLSDENSVLGILIFFKYSFLLNIHLIKY